MNADLSGTSMYGTIFSGSDLRGAKITGAHITLSLFDGANMQGAVLSNAKLFGTSLAGVNLVNASLLNAKLDIDTSVRTAPTMLDGSIMRGARLAGSSLVGTTFAGTDLTQADFSKGETTPVIFSETRLVNGEELTLGANLVGANLTKADFEGANLSHVNLQGADLEGTRFKFANLSFANLEGANLHNSDMRGANMSHVDLSRASLYGTNLAGANLSEAILNRTTFEETTLVSTSPIELPVDLSYNEFILKLADEDCLDGVFLVRGTADLIAFQVNMAKDLGKEFYDSGEWRSAVLYLCPANMSGIQLRGKVSHVLYVAGVNFSNADFQNSDLTKMVFEDLIQVEDMQYRLKADLTDILYNEFTTWPTGFIPPSLPVAPPQSDMQSAE